MPYCPRCGNQINPAFGAVCVQGHSYAGEDEDAVSASAKQLERDFVDRFLPMKTPFTQSAGLFLQAIHCCINKDYDACAVMCRVAVESAFVESEVMKKDSRGFFVTDPVALDLVQAVQFQYRGLVKLIAKKGLIDRELATKSDRIRALGNFATHLEEQKFREIAKFMANPSKPFRMWVAPEEAYWALNAVREILLHMAVCIA